MTDNDIFHDLSQISLFYGLTPDQLALFGQSLHRKTIPAGQPLLTLGFKSEIVYFLLQGTVRVSVPQGGGGAIINICGSGSVLGEISALDGSGHSADVITIEPCQLLWMSQINFSKHLLTTPMLGYNLSRLLARRLRHATQQTQLMARRSIPVRVASQLLDFARHYMAIGDEGARSDIFLPLRLSQTDFAATISSTRISVNKVLGDFARQNWISIDRHQRITIHDLPALEALCNNVSPS